MAAEALQAETLVPAAPARGHDHVAVMDGLRGVAIALVIWLHLWELSWLPNEFVALGYKFSVGYLAETGFVGVDLFFFISGFCLFYPYARHRLEGAAAQTWGRYAYRRAIKIVPSYFLSIALIGALGFGEVWRLPDAGWQLFTHAFFIHNWFQDTIGSYNTVLWSLAVEVQFYLLFVLICPAFCRWPLATYAAMMLVAIEYRSDVFTYWHDDARFLLPQLPGYLDLFANGMAAAYALVSLRLKPGSFTPRSQRLATGLAVLSTAAMLLLLYSLYLVRYKPEWPILWEVHHRHHLAFAFLGLSLGSAFAVTAWRKLVANRLLVFLSVISYNLYLWHQVLYRQLVKYHVPQATTVDLHKDPTWQWQFTLVGLVVAIGVSSVLTYGFERPLLRLKWRALAAKLRGAGH